MADLKSCSFFDEQRALISHETASGAQGAKIMTYSALKLAIVNSDLKHKHKDSYLSAFTELKAGLNIFCSFQKRYSWDPIILEG